ncbi:recombinase family protein [Neobacillus sp. YIM B06451]|uniref:recombinase family protein n=1 Tax=Neobacillus sp. YIM B06451 TaxID=3070994 RepID=UPI00292FB36B|nr:recombinase family protein [Neobacillus sp. YIM B06451]
MKRVWAYYRVSTKSQVLHHDVTLQRKACSIFVSNKPEWQMCREIEDLGVSGLDARKGLQRIRWGAQFGRFDVLLVFMLDRLGRNPDEMKNLINELHRQGIEVWSVVEGSIEEFSDLEKKYFIQSRNEVEKTSQRVKRRFQQLNEEGIFTGGTAPFGYSIASTDSRLTINKEEAEIIKQIFNLASEQRYGCSRIAQELNEKGVSTRSKKPWIYNTISRLLRNPIYIGRPAFNKYGPHGKKINMSQWKHQPKNENLVIINDDQFFKVQELMDGRRPSKGNLDLSARKDFLLDGLAYCGYCGRRLKPEVNKNRPKSKHGVKKEPSIYRRYVCDHAKNKLEYHGQRDFGADKHEKLIINVLTKTIAGNGIVLREDLLLNDITITEKQIMELDKTITNYYFRCSADTKKLQKLLNLLNELEDRYFELLEQNKIINRVKDSLVNFSESDFAITLQAIFQKVILSRDGIDYKLNSYVSFKENNLLYK